MKALRCPAAACTGLRIRPRDLAGQIAFNGQPAILIHTSGRHGTDDGASMGTHLRGRLDKHLSHRDPLLQHRSESCFH